MQKARERAVQGARRARGCGPRLARGGGWVKREAFDLATYMGIKGTAGGGARRGRRAAAGRALLH